MNVYYDSYEKATYAYNYNDKNIVKCRFFPSLLTRAIKFLI